MPEPRTYTVQIEAEWWPPEEWNWDNDNTDVFVTFEDKSRWVATFFTYSNIGKLTEKNKRTGECMSGAYFWASDMVLIDQVSRARIEEVIRYLLQEGEFEGPFTRLPAEDEEDT